MSEKKKQSESRLDDIVAKARRDSETRGHGYREQALKMYPWICGRCSREFTRANLQELTVHHKNHDHDYNPSDGSNWELLCLYCHDNEHSKHLGEGVNEQAAPGDGRSTPSTHRPFEGLADLLGKKS